MELIVFATMDLTQMANVFIPVTTQTVFPVTMILPFVMSACQHSSFQGRDACVDKEGISTIQQRSAMIVTIVASIAMVPLKTTVYTVIWMKI